MPTAAPSVHRIEVRPRPGQTDPRAAALARDAGAIGLPVSSVAVAQIYLIEADLSPEDVRAVAERLLADPVTEAASEGAGPRMRSGTTIEVHPLPGVMDPVAQSVREAIRDLLGLESADGVQVSTALRYDLGGLTEAQGDLLARRLLANQVIHSIHAEPFCPSVLPRGHEYTLKVRHVPLRDLSDEQLTKLSRDAHLFLSLEEMKAIQAEYRRLGREPSDIELETLAQTWSEHCVHKTLKSRIRYRSDGATKRRSDGGGDPIQWSGRPGHTVGADGAVTIDNLLKSTVAAATFELIADGVDWTLSVFKDNAGVIAFDENMAVCVKVETHNHPSALEPYGGAATGIGGCIRDVIGTGLGAKPIASTDVFCVAFPGTWKEDAGKSNAEDAERSSLPPGTLHPRRTLTQVVAGVRDYGNRMGIPTVNGAIAFDDRYVGNPLVFCGCIGVMPRNRIQGQTRPGDLIVALGGRTGRDGIHGATFSSAELEQTHADEFSHAVQIGNAIEEKRVLDAILRARDEGREPLFHAITDCGAGGFSSAVGEMGSQVGAEVHLEKAPLKYAGLSYTEIWISEAQERMVLAVPPGNLDTLRAICVEENVELSVLGRFGSADATGQPELVLQYHGTEVGRLSMHLLHDGLPQPTREATWSSPRIPPAASSPSSLRRSIAPSLLALLSHPNIASKHWIIRQYDHEVQGNTLVKPLVGPAGRGPSDAAVIEPVPGSGRGLAISCGLQTGLGDAAIGGDPYLMTLAAIDECVRNLVCVGTDPSRIAILDNFCWPSCAKPENLGSLVRAAEGCYDGAKAYRTPFVSGKDSLNNQLRYTDPATGRERLIEIPPTLLITGIGIAPDTSRCITMDAKKAGNTLILVGRTTADLGGSHVEQVTPEFGHSPVPSTDLALCPRLARAVHQLILAGLVRSAHDCSDGGLLAAIAEMLIAADGSSLGADLDLGIVHADPVAAAFAETPGRYVLEVAPADLPRIRELLEELPWCEVGRLTGGGRLRCPGADVDIPVSTLAEAWLRPLDW